MAKASLWGLLLLGCGLTIRGIAQSPDSVEALGSCRAVDLEGRLVRKVALSTPFDPLHLKFVRNTTSFLKGRLPIKSGSLYRDVDANAAISEIERGDRLAPPSNFGLPISGTVSVLRAWNCVEENGHPVVDLDFYFIPAQIPTFWPSTQESKTQDTTDAAHSSGVAPRRFWLTPHAGYSASTRVLGGVSLRLERPSGIIDSFTLDASASPQVRFFSAAAADGYQPERPWIKQAAFSLGYQYRDEPSGRNRMQSGQGFLEWKAASATFSKAGMIIRYGMAFEGGIRRSSGPTVNLADDSRLVAIKGFTGTTLRTLHHTFAASYGFLGGHTGNVGVFDFRKHLLDVSHGLSFSPNHYPLEIDTHFATGFIETLCRRAGCDVPLADRFFGGNVERNFLSDRSWVIRSQPLLRSLPLNGLNAGGGGGNRFLAINMTAAFGIARKPLIPDDLLKEDGFLRRIDATTQTATELLASTYAGMDKTFLTDPGIQMAVKDLLPMIRTEMSTAQDEWEKRADSIRPEEEEDFDICGDDQLAQVPLDLDDVEMQKQPITLLSNRSSSLSKAIKNCLIRFSRASNDPLIISANRLESLRNAINTAVERTQVYDRAKKQAQKDMSVAGRTIHTLFHETNLISFSPTFVFDAAALGPAVPGTPSIRYGVGGGGRFTILSTVRLTLGYAVNVRRQPGEGPGAIFASMEILDIWGR